MSPVSHDAPEEVVRREEHEIAAEIAVALDEVVLARRDVLVVAGEDDRGRTPRRARAGSALPRGRTARARRPSVPSVRASAGTAGRSGGSCTERLGSGTAARAARSSSSSPRTRSRPRRPRPRRAGCRPATSASASRRRRDARRGGAAGRRRARSRRDRPTPRGARSRGRSASRRSRRDTTRRPRLVPIGRFGVTGTPFMVLSLRVTTRSGPERKSCSFRPRALFEITSFARLPGA